MISFFAQPATIKRAIEACDVSDRDFDNLKISKRKVMKMNEEVKETLIDVLADVAQGNQEGLARRVNAFQLMHSMDDK